jgi:O-antigen/teichoic acid export membrane protein
VTLPVTLGCALAGFGVWALVAGALVNPAVRSIATLAFAPWRPGLRIGGARVKEVIHFSLATLGIKMMWALRESANTLVIGKVTGRMDIVGLYSMAEEIALLPCTKITTVVNMLSTPVMAELQADVGAMRAAFYRAMRLTAAIALPASAGIALVSDEMVAVLLGPKWVPAVPIVRLLCVYAGLRGIDVLLPPVLFARRREKFLVWYCFALLILAPTAGTIGALWNGAQGTVMLATPVYCAVMVVMAREALAEMKSSVAELCLALWPIVAATALMTVAVLLLRQLASDALPNLASLRLVFLSTSGAIVYGAALFAIGSPVTAEGIEVLAWMIRRRRAEG